MHACRCLQHTHRCSTTHTHTRTHTHTHTHTHTPVTGTAPATWVAAAPPAVRAHRPPARAGCLSALRGGPQTPRKTRPGTRGLAGGAAATETTRS
jgi:hypothetical protein